MKNPKVIAEAEKAAATRELSLETLQNIADDLEHQWHQAQREKSVKHVKNVMI